jgi:hypothetical protein
LIAMSAIVTTGVVRDGITSRSGIMFLTSDQSERQEADEPLRLEP